ncbi:MAG: Sir2 family NAD-dependent protein deacetylase, partial [Pseudomonadota bacterium]
VRCMGCERRSGREDFQQRLLDANPGWDALEAGIAPDGDADLETDFSTFVVPDCPYCGGLLKPDVVFFGENVPRERVEAVHEHLQQADAVLVVGSSLMVYSGFRFVQAAAKAGLPVVALNRGRTRADDLLLFKDERDCAEALATWAAR